MEQKKKKRNTKKERSVGKYCEKCGFHIKGKNHEEGDHHKRGEKGKLTAGKAW